MKTTIVIGENSEQTKIKIKRYVSGMEIVESGEARVDVVGKKPILEKIVEINKKDKKEMFNNPSNFEIKKGKLVRKGKNK